MKTSRYCAIYTRKSTEEGLDMDFNSLDAQREACESFIISQKSEGWLDIKKRYDDGGFSGGSMERPALKELIEDVKAGKVHIIVVYKIDRLTRSLMDFSKLVQVFDEHGVTFVSVTQSFNTTTSMGRLTLNVLLSFAQFEREVTAERIRDKVAASKKKGMWMGGNTPVGYECVNKELLVNAEWGKVVCHIFERYLALGSVSQLKYELDSEGFRSPVRVNRKGKESGGAKFSRGLLYKILSNPVYIGRIRHKAQVFDGRHEPIIAMDLWMKVQQRLQEQMVSARGHKKYDGYNLLKGRLFDLENTPYSPSYSQKGKKKYCYYVSQNLLQYRDHPNGVLARLPASETEKIIFSSIRKRIESPPTLAETLSLDFEEHYSSIHYISKNFSAVLDSEIIRSVEKVRLYPDKLVIEIKRSSLSEILSNKFQVYLPRSDMDRFDFEVPYKAQRSKMGAVVISPPEDKSDIFDMPPDKLKDLIRGFIWRDEHFSGMSLQKIAKREGHSEGFVGKCIFKTFEFGVPVN